MGKRYIYKGTYFWTVAEADAERKLIRDDLEEQGEFERPCRCGCGNYKLTEKEIEALVDKQFNEIDRFALEYEKDNLGVYTIDGRLLTFVTLGLWDGDRRGYGLGGDELSGILQSYGGEEVEVYVDDDGEVHYTAVHHDGRNRGVVRYIPSEFDAKEVTGKLNAAICKMESRDAAKQAAGVAEFDEVRDKYTKPLGLEIGEIYGWGGTPDGFKSALIMKPEYAKYAKSA